MADTDVVFQDNGRDSNISSISARQSQPGY